MRAGSVRGRGYGRRMATAPARDRSVVPVRAAASVVVIAERDGLDVLLLHRRAGSAFVGGMVVFPGGAVDESDRSAESRRIVAGDVEVAVGGTGVGSGHVVAAVRETLEEVGIWLGTSPEGPLGARWSIDSGTTLIADVAVPGSVRTDLIPHAGRFITPPGAPRRYDTHFFVARAERAGADLDALVPDGREVVDVEWSAPDDALDRITRGALSAMEPTVIFLEALTRYRTADDVIRAARRRRRIDHGGDWTTI